MSDSYHTIGAQRDRARTWSYLERIAVALERIADSMEQGPEENPEEGPEVIPSLEDLEMEDLTKEEAKRLWEILHEDA